MLLRLENLAPVASRGKLPVFVSLALLTATGLPAQSTALSAATPVYDRTLESVVADPLPKWIRLSGEFRTRVEGRTGFNYQPDNNDAYGLIRNRLNLELRPVKSVDFFFQGQDSRVPGLDAGRAIQTFRDTFDLRQAYIRVKAVDGLVRLTVGRQILLYGNQRLIGPSDWTNVSRTWDAIKLEIGTADAKVDLFASSVVVIDPAHPDHHHDGNNIHGAYGSFRRVVPHAVVEPYLLWKTGGVSIWTGGLRAAAMPGTSGLHGFDYQIEFARQWGTAGTLPHSAYAGYGIAGYTLSSQSWTPRISAEFSHASGNHEPGSGASHTFDQLQPTDHMHYGLTDPIGWRNMNIARLGLDAKPTKGLQWNLDYREIWLDSARDALYAIGGTVAVAPRPGNTARKVGREIDFSTAWTVSAQWKLGAGVGHLAAGRFLKENSNGSGQTFPYLFAQFAF